MGVIILLGFVVPSMPPGYCLKGLHYYPSFPLHVDFLMVLFATYNPQEIFLMFYTFCNQLSSF
jgi:hypothetical protein